MQKKGANISLKGYDDIFSTDQSRAEAQQERVQEIPLSDLHPFEGHPFRVVDDEEMLKTAESVREFGVLTPAIVRPDPDGGYEIISGHRRHRASELAGKETMPAIVRDMDDDAAIILMVDSNLQRETLLPSERAFAYRMKLDAIKHQGQTCGQVGHKSRDSIPFHSLNPLPFAHGEAATPPERKRTEAKSNSAVEIYREIIKDNIEYDHLIQNCKIDKDRLDEIVDLMLETVCTARKTIRIAGDDYPAELVKSKFLKLNSSHIEFVLDCMRENTTKVRNIKQYLKAVLFNAPSTIDSYYTALVNHDLYGGE